MPIDDLDEGGERRVGTAQAPFLAGAKVKTYEVDTRLPHDIPHVTIVGPVDLPTPMAYDFSLDSSLGYALLVRGRCYLSAICSTGFLKSEDVSRRLKLQVVLFS